MSAQDTAPATTDPEVAKLIRRVTLLEQKALRVRLPADLDAQLVTFTSSATANQLEPVEHVLRRTPQGYMVVRQIGAGTVYEDAATPAWTSSKLFLKCSGTGVQLTLLVF